MTRWTEEQYEAYKASQCVPQVELEPPESALQSKIVKYCKSMGYPCLSLRQSTKARGFITPGWPDCTIILPGCVCFIELKAKKGYLSKKQREMALMFTFLGHKYHKVKTYKRFIEIISKGKVSGSKGGIK